MSVPLEVGDEVSGMVVDSYIKQPNKSGRLHMREYTLSCATCGWVLVTKRIGYLRKRVVGCEQCRPPAIKYTVYVPEAYFYMAVKSNAKYRGVEFDMTFEEFRDNLSNECHYCGGPGQERFNVSKTESVVVCGFDRVDNTQGYKLNNVVPCCYSCNKAKGTKTYEEFIKWLDNLVAFRKDIK